jgi:hypothetical protein
VETGKGVNLFTPLLPGLELRSQPLNFNARNALRPCRKSIRHAPPRSSHFGNQKSEIVFEFVQKCAVRANTGDAISRRHIQAFFWLE